MVKKGLNMTRFENLGVNYQYSSLTVEEADRNFKFSCDCCVRNTRCSYNRCDRCAISVAHSLVVAAISENNNGKEN